MCSALFGLGTAAMQAEEDAAARALLEEGVALACPANRDVEVSALVILGAVATRQGDLAGATDCFRKALLANATLGNQDYLSTLLDYMAGLPVARGEYARALCLYGAAEALNERLGARPDAGRLALRRRWLPQAQRALTATEQAAAWAAGRAMSPDEVVSDALEYLAGAVGRDRRPGRPS